MLTGSDGDSGSEAKGATSPTAMVEIVLDYLAAGASEVEPDGFNIIVKR